MSCCSEEKSGGSAPIFGGLKDASIEEAAPALEGVRQSLTTQIPESTFTITQAKKQIVSGTNWFLSVRCGHGETIHIRVFGDFKLKYTLVRVLRGKQETDDLEYIGMSEEYDYNGVHSDLEQDLYSGSYGWDNAAYHAIAEAKAKIDLHSFHGQRTTDECYIESFLELIRNPETMRLWENIVTFDPFGMTATRPTIAATTAILNVPELMGDLTLSDDYGIVNEDGSVNTTKAAVYYAWNIPKLSKRLGLTEDELRECLQKYTKDSSLLDPKIRTFLPQVGGMTIYTFGDVRKLRQPKTKIAVRVHDECNGSDVFGTDICTCRPYLVFALKAAIECAQSGGVGVVVYFRKEGRSLGEVTKYRVYNARKNQSGGDSAEKYFFQTESIAGIRDARFQGMMPDVLNWLGIDKIDYLMSMSNEKFDAITAAGIKVDQRIPLPDYLVPAHAEVELTAKIASGYHAEDGHDFDQVLNRVLGLDFVREQCNRIFDLCVKGELEYFKYDASKLDECADYVIRVTQSRYPDLNQIPMHSRLRHFQPGELDRLCRKWQSWGLDKAERTRRIIDLVYVSVLLDAGAGPNWKYITKDGRVLTRSEGLAAASLDMFQSGIFSSDAAVRHRVNARGLNKLTTHQLNVGFQSTDANVMIGLKGRAGIMNRLGETLRQHPEFYGYEVSRPGGVLDYVLKQATKTGDDGYSVSVHTLWKAISLGLVDMWPERAFVLKKGDVWFHPSLKQIGKPGSDAVSFHKLQQWLCYSVVEVLTEFGVKFTDMSAMTALAEYRNGGLLIDTGVLVPQSDLHDLDVGSAATVEWRALTVVAMDKLATVIRSKLGKSEEELPLAMILEGGTWQAGREIAREKRKNGLPPLNIVSDGTVF